MRDLFELPEWSRVAEGMLSARMVYFSGITLSLFSSIGLGRFLATLEARAPGHTACGWRSTAISARPAGRGDVRAAPARCSSRRSKRVDVALPTFDDEAILWGDPSPESTVERMQAFGIAEVVVKNGPSSALVASETMREHVPVPQVIEPVDPTAAGDGFNAGYLAARLTGAKPLDAAAAAHRLAGEVIRHRGAIMPRVGCCGLRLN